MDSLAAVEVGLILHGLTCRERILVARCSRSLLHVASQPFSWLHTLVPFEPPHCAVGGGFHSRLLVNAPKLFRWFRIRDAADISGLHLAMERLRPRGLDTSYCSQIAPDLWNQILTARSDLFNRIRVLTMHAYAMQSRLFSVDPTTIRLICALPLLDTLTISTFGCEPSEDAAHWSPLQTAPSLTCLTLIELRRSIHSVGLMEQISLCPRLTQLALPRTTLSVSAFHLSLSCPSLLSLQLTLISSYGLRRVPTDELASEYALSFLSLHRLEHLHLHQCARLDDMLQHAHHARNLLRLIVEPGCNAAAAHTSIFIPSLPAVAGLMQELSALHYSVLLLPASNGGADTSQADSFAAPFRESFGRRFTLRQDAASLWL